MKATWTHRDMLRLSHPKNVNPSIAKFILTGEVDENAPALIQGFNKVQNAKTEDEVVAIVKEYGLPWETIPTQWHKSLKVWRTLFEAGMGQTALVRNTVRFARLGAFNDLKFAAEYANKLANPEAIYKGKMHPIQYLNAAVVFETGQISRDNIYSWRVSRIKNWEINGKVLKALQEGFYVAFKNVEPANKRILVGLDVSGSMSQSAMGLDLSCAQVGAAVAMQLVRTEPYAEIRGFSNEFVDLGITENDTLGTAMRKVQKSNFGGTDCALPMLYAKKKNMEIDTFVTITDSETWFGNIHPHQALKQYRKEFVSDARMAVLGVAGSEFTVADSADKGAMDFVGFDSNAPKVLADFAAGRL